MPYLNGILPAQPAEPALLDAFRVIERAEAASEAFFQAFDDVRRARNAQGAPTDNEQDLLRAGLTFATAGLDAMAKQLVRDTLCDVIKRDEGAQQQFAGFVESRLRRVPVGSEHQFDSKFMASLLVSPSPRDTLEQSLINQLTGSSLQSKDELLRVAAYFAIPAAEITTNPNHVRDIFNVRNQIAHEMDIDFTQPNRSRRPRRRQDMVRYTRDILTVACAFLRAVQVKLAQPVI
jgi:hypothetical protein